MIPDCYMGVADMFYTKTVTIFNKYMNETGLGEEVWLSTVLENVRLLVTKGANVSTSGLSDADTASLHIHKTNLPKPYLPPLEWQKSEHKEDYFTLSGEDDFFVEGDLSGVTPAQDDFFGKMKATYNNCFKITNVDDYDLIAHWEVGGK